MASTPQVVHQLAPVFARDDTQTYRVSFCDGDVFRLRQLTPTDHSFDEGIAKWMAEIVEAVSGALPDFHQRFQPGSFVEFLESDIREIIREETGETLFSST